MGVSPVIMAFFALCGRERKKLKTLKHLTAEGNKAIREEKEARRTRTERNGAPEERREKSGRRQEALQAAQVGTSRLQKIVSLIPAVCIPSEKSNILY